jgi:heat shock protein HslJ
VAVIVMAVLLAGACSNDGGTSDPPPDGRGSTTAAPVPTEPDPSDAAGFAGRVWRVVGVVEGDVVQPPPPGLQATVLVADGRISGSAGCNDYSGPVESEGTSLRVGNLITTERGCLETVDWLPFLETLVRAQSVTRVGDGYLIDASPDGAIVLQ